MFDIDSTQGHFFLEKECTLETTTTVEKAKQQDLSDLEESKWFLPMSENYRD